MYFTFPCPECGKKLKVQEEAAGRRCGCPYCKHSITVPEPSAEPEPPPRPDGTEEFKGIGGPGERPGVAGRRTGPPRLPSGARRRGSSDAGWSERTDVNMVTGGLLAVVFSVAFYAVLFVAWAGWNAVFPPPPDAPDAAVAESAGGESGGESGAESAGAESALEDAAPAKRPPKFYLGELFVHRGWVPFVLVFLMSWSVAFLLLKSQKLKKQRTSMLFDLLPNELGDDITSQRTDRFIEHIRGLPVQPGESFLVDRVMRGLEHFRVRNSNPEVAAVLTSHSEIDANAVQSSYTLQNVFIWAIPILGFIGTVIGISAAVSGFSGSMEDAQNILALKGSLNNVTTGLATAFDTTLIALVMSLLVMFPSSSMQKSEEDMLNSVDEYCNENLLKRLNDGGEGAGGQPRGELSTAALRRAIDAALVPHHAELQSWREKLEAIGGSLADRIVEGYDRVHEQLQERQDDSAEQVEDLDVMVAAFQDALTGLTRQTQTVHQQAAESMRQSADSLSAWCTALEQGLGGLNAVLEKLGERQVVVQTQPRRSWLFWRNSRD